jgi:hypothetical protein
MPRLPVELVRMIFKYCSPQDLVAASRGNSVFREITKPLLYKNIATIYSRRRCVLFLKTLCGNPALAATVRKLDLNIHYLGSFGVARFSPFLSFPTLFRKAFKVMSRLSRLKLSVHGSCNGMFPGTTLSLKSPQSTTRTWSRGLLHNYI